MKKVLISLLLTGVLLSACVAERAEPEITQMKFISSITQDLCQLCSYQSNSNLKLYRGQDNVGIIDLNSFEVKCVEINRYDLDGQLVEEATGVFTSRVLSLGETTIHHYLDVDRGYADISIPLDEDEGIDPEALGRFLCEDCLHEFSSRTAHTPENVGEIVPKTEWE